MKRVLVVGAGFGGLSAAAFLARDGYDVTVLEKNSWVGGRAREFTREGFRFDMGPSWYWMPREHDQWFQKMGRSREEFYEIHRVDPSYRVYFDTPPGEGPEFYLDIPADPGEARKVFEGIEPGSGERLGRYLEDCAAKYTLAMDSFIFRNYYSIFDFLHPRVVPHLPRLNLFQSYAARVRRQVQSPALRKILEFPVVFLGSRAGKTPAVYTLMNHVDFSLGTWYPQGGFSAVARAMQQVCEDLGVRFRLGHEVTALRVEQGRARSASVHTQAGETYQEEFDQVVANADYHHVEQQLLSPEYRSVSPGQWDRLSLAPAVVNYYLAFDRPLDEFQHHTFFFDAPWEEHFQAVYEKPRWIDKPLFYLHLPSRTDRTCAPPGKEALFLLIPVAPGLEDTPKQRQIYLDQALDRMEEKTGRPLRKHLIFQETMSLREFSRDYHAFKGNAFGLGQTLFQTAWFRLKNRSKKVSNLYYAGQYTVPGTGTTMSMISGEVVASRLREGR